jgi:hypothetical protein
VGIVQAKNPSLPRRVHARILSNSPSFKQPKFQTATRSASRPGGGQRISFPRCSLHPSFVARSIRNVASQKGTEKSKGSGAPNGASSSDCRPPQICWRNLPNNPRRHGRGPQKGAARLSALHCGCFGPGQRFLGSPDANGRTLSGTSAASTSQSGHAPDGLMPGPPASQKVTNSGRRHRTRSVSRRHRLTSLTTSRILSL